MPKTTSKADKEREIAEAAADDTKRRLSAMRYNREARRRMYRTKKVRSASEVDELGRVKVNGTDFTIDANRLGPLDCIGSVLYGAPGGHPAARHMIAAEDMVDELSREVGQPVDVCRKLFHALGRVAQNRLLAGKVVGIPFVGILAVVQRPPATEFRMKIRRAAIQDEIAYCKKLKAAGYRKRGAADIDKMIACLERRLTRPYDPINRHIAFTQPRILRTFFRANMQYNGHYLDEVRALWENQANLKKQVVVAESEWNVLKDTREILIKSGHKLPPLPERPHIPKETPNVQRILKELREHCINVRLGITPEEARLVGRGPQRGDED